MDTPEFLVWALEYTCPIRGFQDGSDPERTERHLRAARAVSDARRESRVFDGLCVDPPNGFRIDDALVIHGGLSTVEQTCGACPANAASQVSPSTLAGCFGILPVAPEPQIVAAVDRFGFGTDYAQIFTPTQPRWYGFWMRSPLSQSQLSFLLDVFGPLDAKGVDGLLWRELQAGLRTALDASLPFHATLYPRGRVEGASWWLMPHCRRCKAPWNETGAQRCAVCGYTGNPTSDQKRKARGKRPYFPLDRLLGQQTAADFLVRYEAFQKQSELIPPAQIPPREVRRDNPPAD